MTAAFALFQVGGASALGWVSMKIGAGGLINALDIAPDGTLVCRADVFGAYVYNRTASNPGNAGGVGCWQQLLTTTSLASQSALINTPTAAADGVYEIRVSPSNSQIFYMGFIGYVWISANKGATWTRTAFALDSNVEGNNLGNARNYFYKMAVDPADSDGCIIVTPTNGAQETINGTTTGSWSAISGVAANDSNKIGLVAFDPSSGLTGGRTNKCYISVSGAGLYQRTTPTGGFALVAGTPTQIAFLTVASDGTVYVVTTGGDIYNLIGSTWTKITPTYGAQVAFISVHPALPGTVYAWGGSGGNNGVAISTNANTTTPTWDETYWQNGSAATLVANDIPWLATQDVGVTEIGGLQCPIFDTLDNTKIWTAMDQGIWQISLPATKPFVCTSFSSGIEEIVAQWLIVPPGFPPVCLGQDVAIIQQQNPGVKYATQHAYPSSSFLCFGSSADYASNNSSFVAAITDFQSAELSAYSTDGGRTWTQFPTYPSAATGGTIACASSTEWIWIPLSGPVWHTGDGGHTWTNLCTTLGLPTDGWRWSNYLNRKNVAADRVNIGTFYLTNYVGNSAPGTYVVTNNGTVKAYYANSIDLGDNSKMLTVPGNAGHVFFSSGEQGGAGPAANWPHNQLFYYSHDGGQTWNDVSNLSSGAFTIREVWSYGFGASGPGQTYPSIWLYGWVAAGASPSPSGSQPGVWVSYDGGETWMQKGGMFPLGWTDQVTIMEGDMTSYDRVYIGCKGSGWAAFNPTT